VIPVSFRGRKGSYTHCMFLNDEGPIAGGRELWGFPKKLAQPTLRTEIDTLVGTLDYGPLRVATGTMGYKHREADLAQVKASLAAPNFLLKIIPHVDGTPRICELVEYHLEDGTVKGAWTGPAALHLSPHALAPVADLSVLEIVSAIHVLADLTLGLGRVAHDYLRQPSRQAPVVARTIRRHWCRQSDPAGFIGFRRIFAQDWRLARTYGATAAATRARQSSQNSRTVGS
jgi:acetoacetate decarboxylase